MQKGYGKCFNGQYVHDIVRIFFKIHSYNLCLIVIVNINMISVRSSFLFGWFVLFSGMFVLFLRSQCI